MLISINTEFADVLSRLDSLRDALGSGANSVIARSLNRIGESTKTQAVREINREFMLKQAEIRERIVVQRAFAQGRLYVDVNVTSVRGKRSLNLIRFLEKKVSFSTARRRRKDGTINQLFVSIKRGSPLESLGKYAFIGNKGRTIFTRRQRDGSTSGRLPIRPLQTIDVGQMFNTKRVGRKLLLNIREKFPVEFERQLSFELKKRGIS